MQLVTPPEGQPQGFWGEGGGVGSPEWGGSLLSVCQLLSWSSKQLYPNSSGYTNPPSKANSRMLGAVAARRGLHCKAPSHQRSTEMSPERPLFQKQPRPPEQRRLENGPQHPVGPTQPEGELRREFQGGEKDVGVLPCEVGGGHSRGCGEAGGDLGVSGGPLSSLTLGVCGAGTCGKRSGSMSCTGTS